MNLTSPTIIKQLCKKHNLHLTKRKGQNFLIDQSVLDKIIENSNLKKDETVLEIGPGLGCLTFELARKVKKVIAVELDKRMIKILKDNLNVSLGFKTQAKEDTVIEIINENILDYQINHSEKYKLIANLPYVITSAVLKKFLTIKTRPSLMVVMIQKEVANRIVASPGQMSLLALNCQLYATPKILFQVSKDSFWPKPEVDSAVISLKPKSDSELAWVFKPRRESHESKFWQLAKIGFSSKRKKLINNLATGLHLDKQEVAEKLGRVVDVNSRAQNLSVEDWIKLTEIFQANIS